MNVYIKNLAKLTTNFITESKFECDQTSHLLGTTKVRSASTQRQAGSGTTFGQQQALLPQDGNRLHGGNLLHGHRHQNGVNDFFYQDVSLTGNGDCLVSDGGVKTTSHSRTRDVARFAQDLSHRVNRNRCVSQNSHTSFLAQHVTRALVFCFLHT